MSYDRLDLSYMSGNQMSQALRAIESRPSTRLIPDSGRIRQPNSNILCNNPKYRAARQVINNDIPVVCVIEAGIGDSWTFASLIGHPVGFCPT